MSKAWRKVVNTRYNPLYRQWAGRCRLVLATVSRNTGLVKEGLGHIEGNLWCCREGDGKEKCH
jgi:hypothetical protein